MVRSIYTDTKFETINPSSTLLKFTLAVKKLNLEFLVRVSPPPTNIQATNRHHQS